MGVALGVRVPLDFHDQWLAAFPGLSAALRVSAHVSGVNRRYTEYSGHP